MNPEGVQLCITTGVARGNKGVARGNKGAARGNKATGLEKPEKQRKK